jgi:hypothetical protein
MPINMNIPPCACAADSPNIIRAISPLRAGGGIWTMERPLSFSFSSIGCLRIYYADSSAFRLRRGASRLHVVRICGAVIYSRARPGGTSQRSSGLGQRLL